MTFIFVSVLKLAAQILFEKVCHAIIKLMWQKKVFLELTTQECNFCEKNNGNAALYKSCLLCKLFILRLMVSQLPDRCIISSGSGLINGPSAPGHGVYISRDTANPARQITPTLLPPLISHFLFPSFLFLFFLEKIPCSSLHCILTELSLSPMKLLPCLFFRILHFHSFFVYFFGGLECVGHSFAYVAHFVF